MTRRRAVMTLLITLAAAIGVAGCAGPEPSFDPTGPCTADGRAPGAYPELEALLPAVLGGVGPDGGSGGATEAVPPTTVDSGRNCTEEVLASLWGHGVRELRYAGATWDLTGGEGMVSAVFMTPSGQPPLESAWLEEFFESSARASSKAENITVTRPTIDPVGAVFQIEALNDLSLQTVVVWPDGDVVRLVIVATNVEPGADRAAHTAAVQQAVEQSASKSPPVSSATPASSTTPPSSAQP